MKFPGAKSVYRGFARWDFEVAGVPAIVVAPPKADAQRNWIWRAEFWDHEPGVDLGLLANGFHLVHLQVGNTFVCPSALQKWDKFYALLTKKFGFARKVALEGVSRGGLYCYNWAARNPEQVSCIYGDNPVCDFKSWPGGKGVGPGSVTDWGKLIADYEFASEVEALQWPLNPVDNLAPLARVGIPVIHVCGDADEIVPYPENSGVLAARYRALRGNYQEIIKPGGKHHPHGLKDPTPVVDFILSASRQGSTMRKGARKSRNLSSPGAKISKSKPTVSRSSVSRQPVPARRAKASGAKRKGQSGLPQSAERNPRSRKE